MNSIINISEAANLGMHTMVVVAARAGDTVSVRDAAAQLGVSGHHLAKVLQRLAKAGLLLSTRGPAGGFRLRRPPEKVRLLDIYEAIEGRLTSRDCLLGRAKCSGTCIFGDFLHTANQEFKQKLASVSLADAAAVFGGTHGPTAKNSHH